MLGSSQNQEQGLAFIEYLLAEQAQTYFSSETFEYPIASGVQPSVDLVPLDELNAISMDLSALADIQGTILLMQEVGMLP